MSTLTLPAAQVIVAQGCPRTADVKAAKNHVYLSQHGLAGGFQNSGHVRNCMEVITKAERFQEARRVIESMGTMTSSRARWKRQQRPA